MTHAEHIRDLERAVVEAAVARRAAFNESVTGRVEEWQSALMMAGDVADAAVDSLLAARAATCEACKGSGGTLDMVGELRVMGGEGVRAEWVYCPAGCDHGKRKGGA